MNSVDSLIKEPFSRRTLEEKVNIKIIGRPTPVLNVTQKASRGKNLSYVRYFNCKVYDNNSWICGCDVRNALFCFPCVLFGNDDIWSTKGVEDLGHLNEYMKKHSSNRKHINNVVDLSALGNVNIATQLSRAYHNTLQRHNAEIEKNRYILSKIIDL